MALIQSLQNQTNFTATESAIADFILQHPEDFSNFSITELARATSSSKSAITRLCKKLGQDGYKNFRVAVAVELEKHRYERQDIDINYPFTSSDCAASIMQSVNYISKEALDACYASIHPKSMERAARILSASKHIYLYAVGDTYITACAFQNMLMKLGIHCVMAEQYNERLGITHCAGNEDAALVLSYSGRLMQELRTELTILRRSRCATILISSLEEYRGVDHLITIPAQEQAVGKTAGYYSQAAIRYILNCIYGVIYAMDLERNLKFKNRVDGIVQK